ncbi:MAG: hypothetical protein QXU18_01985, partial [Thermoplasmatales archaeon]
SFEIVQGYRCNSSHGMINAVFRAEYLNVSFTPFTFTMKVTEYGLPNNLTWTIEVNGKNYTTRSDVINLSVPNGSYSVLASAQGFSAKSTSYDIVVIGSNVSVNVVFIYESKISIFDQFMGQILYSPITYVILAILVVVYVRFYRGSLRICSQCMSRIPRSRIKCLKCSAKKRS